MGTISKSVPPGGILVQATQEQQPGPTNSQSNLCTRSMYMGRCVNSVSDQVKSCRGQDRSMLLMIQRQRDMTASGEKSTRARHKERDVYYSKVNTRGDFV